MSIHGVIFSLNTLYSLERGSVDRGGFVLPRVGSTDTSYDGMRGSVDRGWSLFRRILEECVKYSTFGVWEVLSKPRVEIDAEEGLRRGPWRFQEGSCRLMARGLCCTQAPWQLSYLWSFPCRRVTRHWKFILSFSQMGWASQARASQARGFQSAAVGSDLNYYVFWRFLRLRYQSKGKDQRCCAHPSAEVDCAFLVFFLTNP